jgi:poly(3-hydroxybutyrate) depolymerase
MQLNAAANIARLWIALLALLAFLGLAGGCRSSAHRLPALGADIEQTSVSGFSAGAYMAGQFQVAHSTIVVGAGIVAGGPYGCAESAFAAVMPGPGAAFLNLAKATNGCMLNAMQALGVPDPAQLAERARQRAAAGSIDPIDGLAGDRIYLFSGANDRTVVAPIVAAAAEFYARLGVPAKQIKLVTDVPAGHAFVTEDRGVDCGRSGAPYITHCHYDQAGELLRHIHGPLRPRSEQPAGDFVTFDQREFTRDLPDHGLADMGVVYIPPACRSTTGCRVHIAFHGCGQNQAALGDTFPRDSGFARWADTNRFIVLFPQVYPSALNPQGCWDWWGYTGRDYLTRKAPQIVAVRRMLDRLAASRQSAVPHPLER